MKRWGYIGSILLLLFITGCGAERIENTVNWPVESFNHIDHNGNDFSLDDLKGKVWVANFMFTSCTTVCPPMTANMARIQRLLHEEGIDNVELVSFSVDPEVDSPEILKEFASTYTDDLSNWHFLTGYAQNYIEQFAKENFKEHVLKPKNDDQVMHGTSLFLVNQEGTIVKYYSNLDVPYDEVLHDIKILINK